MITTKQKSFIEKLLSERSFDFNGDLANLSSREASEMITNLLAAPRKAGQERPFEQGMYRTANGDIFRVQKSRESGNLYAKRLVIDIGGVASFEFESGAMRFLKASDKMSLEDAKAFGVETGICCVCGAFLTDERSVAEGIGPVCRERV